MYVSAPEPVTRASMNWISVLLKSSRMKVGADPLVVRSGPVMPVVVVRGRTEFAIARASARYLFQARSVVPFSETMSIAGAFEGGQIDVDIRFPVMNAVVAGAHRPV